MQKMTFKISGMHCPSCSLRIDGDLEELAGIKSSSTNFAKGESHVEFDDALVTVDHIKQVIQSAGYQIL